MAVKKTTGSKSSSSSGSSSPNEFKPALDADERLNVRYLQLDSYFPHLDDNDCWMYQMRLEAFIRRSAPDNMNTNYLAMVRILCAQARRCNQPPEEEEDGT